MKSILEICQEVADLAATKRPQDLFNPASQQDAIFLSTAKSALDSLLRYGDWQELTKEGILRTSGKKDKYLMEEVCPDFYSILNNTIYVKDGNEKLIGAITPQDWMREKYFNEASSNTKFIIQNGMIKFLTPPADGIKIVFQYRSDVVCLDAKNGYMEKSSITQNSDIPVFDEYLVKLGILWRWLKRNGMDYSEEYNEYEREIKKKFASSMAIKDIILSASNDDVAAKGVSIHVKTDK